MEISNATKEDLDFILSDFFKTIKGKEFLTNLHEQDYLDLEQLVKQLEDLNSEDFRKELGEKLGINAEDSFYYFIIKEIGLTVIKKCLNKMFKEVYSGE